MDIAGTDITGALKPLLPRHHWALRGLPPLPGSVMRLLRLLDDPSADIHQFSDVISTDPAFACEVLRAANSPLFSLPCRIDDLFQAITLIGVEQVRGMVLVAALSSRFQHAVRRESLLACWKHSLATAVLAAEMAPVFQLDPGAAYTAGLLHDLGRLVLMTAYPAKYAELIDRSFHESLEMNVIEEQFFEINHCVAGAAIACSWGLPISLADVCLAHHDRLGENSTPLLQAVIVANRRAHTFGFQPVYEPKLPDVASNLPHWVSSEIGDTATRLHSTIDSYCT